MDAVLGDNVPLLVPTALNETLPGAGSAQPGVGIAPPVADVDLNNCEVEDLQAGSLGQCYEIQLNPDVTDPLVKEIRL